MRDKYLATKDYNDTAYLISRKEINLFLGLGFTIKKSTLTARRKNTRETMDKFRFDIIFPG